MKRVIILHHHEIALKGRNRGSFERQLRTNVIRALKDVITPPSVAGGYGRFIVPLPDAGHSRERDERERVALERLKRLFGLANICVGVEVEQNIDLFCSTAEHLLASALAERASSGFASSALPTVKVITRRADKRFPLHSMEVNARVGAHLCNRFGLRVNLSSPDETIHIEIANGTAYLYRSKEKGAGGLPVGVSAKVAALMSAGFDSPVASYRMMKRGALVEFIHFHSHPYVARDSVDQVRQLVQVLTSYQFDSKLHVVPFGDAQQEIVAHTPASLRMVLYRRFMVRIAEAIAMKANAQALVTGESLGQVASQTLRNISVIDAAAQLPIFRPLIGMDKEEIIELARQIGTHDISKQPYDDCCSFLTPRNPETWADPRLIDEAEAGLDGQKLIEMCLTGASAETFHYVPDTSKVPAP